MSSRDFDLRWESTGDQWWYASPIDYAAANGQYELVRELINIDPNLLIKLTSLRRIRRLESVWDDQGQLNEVGKCRANVAKKLVVESEVEGGHNSLMRAGYGGWLLYTAASGGDVSFVKELLERDPFLVFGEGEYGITDVLYAAARSKSNEVFKLLMESAIGMRDDNGEGGEFCKELRWEIMNRGVHCAARGGNVEVLKELLVGCSDVFGYRDAQGSTILHSAAGRGQVKVVEDLIASFDNIIHSTDDQGNTALHIAAYRGFLGVVKTLVSASPSLASSTNNQGNTFLHMAVAGFQTSVFRRLDQQLDLIRQLVSCDIINIQNIINCKNNQGRTALHLAVAANIQFNVVELLITVPSIHLNIKDSDGMTPIDLLNYKQHPQCGSSRLLMVSAGGTVSYREDPMSRAPFTAHLKLQTGLETSPGTTFTVPDSELFLYGGKEGNDNNSEDSCSDTESVGFSSVSSDEALSQCRGCALTGIISSSGTARRPKNSMLKLLLQWPKRKNKGNHDETPIPLRERFSKNSSPSLENNKTLTTPTRSEFPSPSSAISRSPMPSPLSPYISKGDTMRSPYSSDKSFNVSGERKPKLFKRCTNRLAATANLLVQPVVNKLLLT